MIKLSSTDIKKPTVKTIKKETLPLSCLTLENFHSAVDGKYDNHKDEKNNPNYYGWGSRWTDTKQATLFKNNKYDNDKDNNPNYYGWRSRWTDTEQ